MSWVHWPLPKRFNVLKLKEVISKFDQKNTKIYSVKMFTCGLVYIVSIQVDLDQSVRPDLQ